MTEPREKHARATGSDTPEESELRPDQEPVVIGTLFFMIIFLIMIFGFWALMYLSLWER